MEHRLRRLKLRTIVALLFAATFRPIAASAQTGANILLVVNTNSKASDEIAEYYSRKRAVPGDQIFHVAVPVTEEISRSAYESQIERPIADWLTTHSAQDRILYLVLTKDIPIRITGTGGMNGTVASVDSDLTLLYRQLLGQALPLAGSVKNPYFAGDKGIAEAQPFTHRTQDVYLVARLDGYTVADVKAMIDRGAAPAQDGVVLLDGRSEFLQSAGNVWLVRSAAALAKLDGWSQRTILDTSAKVLREQPSVLGYYSWGSNDAAIKQRHLQNMFVPGAIGAEFVSTDARTFVEPPAEWLTNGAPFRGSHQSLIGDLVRDGITGVAGHVAEPYLNATIRPDVLFPAYLAGFNLIESFYQAMPFLSWQTVVVGDPLCAPFKMSALAVADLDPAVDPSTELPRFLSERRVAAMTAIGVKPEAARLFTKSEVRLAKNDKDGARQALEQAIAIDGSFVNANLTLANLYGSSGQWVAATDQFRRVLAKNPNHPIALNDLAYALAVELQMPAEALTFAKRAASVPQAPPEATDTLAWVYHLLGQDAEAEPLITVASKLLPAIADVRLHAAVILAANGKVDLAARELDAAVQLNSKLSAREDVQELRRRLPASK